MDQETPENRSADSGTVALQEPWETAGNPGELGTASFTTNMPQPMPSYPPMTRSERRKMAKQIKTPKPPKPPKRLPKSMVPEIPLTNTQKHVRASLTVVALLALGFIFNMLALSPIQHLVSQQKLYNEFQLQLASGTAPVSEGDLNDVLLADGAPVAYVSIPSLGVNEVIVEGTASGTLAQGPGHRRDTVLPGQAGTSVIMGRKDAYGGPFSKISELSPGETFTITTGQGEHVYEVIGLRYAGDPAPRPIRQGESRLLLETARGFWFVPNGVARVDARLVSQVKASGIRQTRLNTLPPEQKELAGDSSTLWLLVFGLQLLIAIELAAVWSLGRFDSTTAGVQFCGDTKHA